MTKQQFSRWKSPHSPRLKKEYQVRRVTKNILNIFFDICRVVHPEFVPQGQTGKTKLYCTTLGHLREDIRHLGPEFFGCTNTI